MRTFTIMLGAVNEKILNYNQGFSPRVQNIRLRQKNLRNHEGRRSKRLLRQRIFSIFRQIYSNIARYYFQSVALLAVFAEFLL